MFLFYVVIVYHNIYKMYSKHKKNRRKKQAIYKTTNLIYFYFVEYGFIFYCFFFIFFLFFLFMFQFEIILFYFPDMFILQLEDVMSSQAQFSFSSTPTRLVDSYIFPQFDKRNYNISSFVGSSSYILFKYRRYIRNLQYVDKYDLNRPYHVSHSDKFHDHFDPRVHEATKHGRYFENSYKYRMSDWIKSWVDIYKHHAFQHIDVTQDSFRLPGLYGIIMVNRPQVLDSKEDPRYKIYKDNFMLIASRFKYFANSPLYSDPKIIFSDKLRYFSEKKKNLY